MALRSTGVIDRDQLGGDIQDIHLEAFNNSTTTITVTLRVFNAQNNTVINTDSAALGPKGYANLTVNTCGAEHTIAQVEHPLNRNDVFTTVYGRNAQDVNLPGATYRHEELIDLA